LNVVNSSELLAQLESATESGGKVTVTAKPSTRRGNVVRNGNVTPAAVTNTTTVASTTKSGMPATVPVNPVSNPVAGPIRTLSY
jgi:hypothetical protein